MNHSGYAARDLSSLRVSGIGRGMNRRQDILRRERLSEQSGSGEGLMLNKWLVRKGDTGASGSASSDGSVRPQDVAGARTISKRYRNRWLLAMAALLFLLAGVTAFFLRDRLLAPPEHVVLSLYGSTSLGNKPMPG